METVVPKHSSQLGRITAAQFQAGARPSSTPLSTPWSDRGCSASLIGHRRNAEGTEGLFGNLRLLIAMRIAQLSAQAHHGVLPGADMTDILSRAATLRSPLRGAANSPHCLLSWRSSTLWPSSAKPSSRQSPRLGILLDMSESGDDDLRSV